MFVVVGSIGRLSLSALNRLIVTRSRVIAASTTRLASAAETPSRTLADYEALAAAATAIDPVTSAVFLDARLVRPPSGVPVSVVADFPAHLVGVGLDDRGVDRRVVKIVLCTERVRRLRRTQP
jgi:hypothetical protein